METKRSFLKDAGVEHPIICGPMYPCSNPELVAAVSEAGGLGVVQPLSLTFVYKYKFREGLRYIRSLTKKPIGLNALIEASSKLYLDRQKQFIDEALEEGVKFIITSLGNPAWVVQRAHQAGAVVYHDVTELKWAQKALDSGVDGFICVNKRAGGHAGTLTAEELYRDIAPLGLPMVCAGGISTRRQVRDTLALGYEGLQLGTRFIATTECKADERYKKAILDAKADDIVLTERLTGVPVAVINSPLVQKLGTTAGPLAKWLLKHPKAKHWMRAYYSAQTLFHFRRTIQNPSKGYDDYWQAGKSVDGISSIKSVSEVMADLVSPTNL
jgi:nitronate monooxygenase